VHAVIPNILPDVSKYPSSPPPLPTYPKVYGHGLILASSISKHRRLRPPPTEFSTQYIGTDRSKTIYHPLWKDEITSEVAAKFKFKVCEAAPRQVMRVVPMITIKVRCGCVSRGTGIVKWTKSVLSVDGRSLPDMWMWSLFSLANAVTRLVVLGSIDNPCLCTRSHVNPVNISTQSACLWWMKDPATGLAHCDLMAPPLKVQ